jgi:YesN/AraC family two-component response regulator
VASKRTLKQWWKEEDPLPESIAQLRALAYKVERILEKLKPTIVARQQAEAKVSQAQAKVESLKAEVDKQDNGSAIKKELEKQLLKAQIEERSARHDANPENYTTAEFNELEALERIMLAKDPAAIGNSILNLNSRQAAVIKKLQEDPQGSKDLAAKKSQIEKAIQERVKLAEQLKLTEDISRQVKAAIAQKLNKARHAGLIDEFNTELLLLRNEAATRIQSLIRGAKARRFAQKLSEEKIEVLSAELEAKILLLEQRLRAAEEHELKGAAAGISSEEQVIAEEALSEVAGQIGERDESAVSLSGAAERQNSSRQSMVNEDERTKKELLLSANLLIGVGLGLTATLAAGLLATHLAKTSFATGNKIAITAVCVITIVSGIVLAGSQSLDSDNGIGGRQ